jgi:hypothetical protein
VDQRLLSALYSKDLSSFAAYLIHTSQKNTKKSLMEVTIFEIMEETSPHLCNILLVRRMSSLGERIIEGYEYQEMVIGGAILQCWGLNLESCAC